MSAFSGSFVISMFISSSSFPNCRKADRLGYAGRCSTIRHCRPEVSASADLWALCLIGPSPACIRHRRRRDTVPRPAPGCSGSATSIVASPRTPRATPFGKRGFRAAIKELHALSLAALDATSGQKLVSVDLTADEIPATGGHRRFVPGPVIGDIACWGEKTTSAS